MSHELDHQPAPFDDASFVSWPDPSPLQSWWDQVMHDHIIPAKTSHSRGQKAPHTAAPPPDTDAAA